MNHKLSLWMYKKIKKYIPMDEETQEIYIYGFELIFSFLICTSIILIIGLIIDQIISTITFLVVFILVRRSTGGFHANTYLKCQLFTIGFYLCVIGLSIHTTVNSYAFLISTLLGLCIIISIGPIENPNKPLSDNEKEKHRKISIILFASANTLGLILKTCYYIGNTIFYTNVLILILMLIPYFNTRIHHHTNSST